MKEKQINWEQDLSRKLGLCFAKDAKCGCYKERLFIRDLLRRLSSELRACVPDELDPDNYIRDKMDEVIKNWKH